MHKLLMIREHTEKVWTVELIMYVSDFGKSQLSQSYLLYVSYNIQNKKFIDGLQCPLLSSHVEVPISCIFKMNICLNIEIIYALC